MDAADASRAEKRNADPGGDDQCATHGGRPDRALNGACGEIARAGFAGVRSEALELARPEAYADPVVEDTDRRRNGSRRAHGGLTLEPDLDPVRRGETVRDERGLERDDGAHPRPARHAPPRRSRRAAARSPGYGIAPERLDAAGGGFEREVGAADDPAGGERVSRSGGVDDTFDGQSWTLVVPERAATCTALEDPVRVGKQVAERLRFGLVREDDVRPELRHRSSEFGDSGRADRAPGREVDADDRALRAAELDGEEGGAAGRLEEQRVAGDEEMIAARRATPDRSPPGEARQLRRDRPPSSGCRPARRASRSTPFRPSAGPHTSTPCVLERAQRRDVRLRRLRASRSNGPARRAPPPTRRRWPPAPRGRS